MLNLFKKIFILYIVSVSVPVLAQQSNPTCENPIGVWQNELGSTLTIRSVDASGQITGEYTSPSGAGPTSFPLIGWVNNTTVSPSDACKSCKENNVKVISFTVHWGQLGSITGWVGTCSITNGIPTIKTTWNLARPNSQFNWDHMLTGSDTFSPKMP